MSEPIDYNSILLRLQELEAKSAELDRLKQDIKSIKQLSDIGTDVATEVQTEIVSTVDILKQQDIVIPFLQKKANEILYKRRGRGSAAIPLLESEILEAQANTPSASKAAQRLGVSYLTYKKYCKMYNIWKVQDMTQKRPNICPADPFKGKYPLPKILEGKFPNFPIHRLKDKLIRSGIKKAECEQCAFSERRLTDGKIPLLLNFEDGDRHNHKLENIRLLCYNCTFVCGHGYIKRSGQNFNLDPDVLQGSKIPIKPRF